MEQRIYLNRKNPGQINFFFCFIQGPVFIDSSNNTPAIKKNHIYINNPKRNVTRQAGSSSIFSAIMLSSSASSSTFKNTHFKFSNSIPPGYRKNKKIVIHPIQLPRYKRSYYKQTLKRRTLLLIITIETIIEENTDP